MKTRLPLYVALTAAAALAYSLACGSSDEPTRQTPTSNSQPTATRCFTDGQYLSLDFTIQNTPQGKFAILNNAHFGSADSEFPNDFNGPDSYLIEILGSNGSVVGSRGMSANKFGADGAPTGPKYNFNTRQAIPKGAAYLRILDTDGKPLQMGFMSAATTERYSLDDLCSRVMQ